MFRLTKQTSQRKIAPRSRHSSLALVAIAVFAWQLITAYAQGAVAWKTYHAAIPIAPVQAGSEVRALEPGKPIERELAGGQTHSYQINLRAGQFLRAVVDQRGIDVLVTVFAPDGKQLVEVDSPNGTQGPEPVSLVAEVSGSYRLEVRSLDKSASAGRYEARIEDLRAATAQDKARVAAHVAFAEAEQLRTQATAKSLHNAIQRYEESLKISQVTGDRDAQADALNGIGRSYSALGDPSKALDHYNQALSIFSEIGRRDGEALMLVVIGGVYDSLRETSKALDYYNRALPVWRRAADRDGEATTLNNIGSIYDYLGEKQKAIDYYNQALPLFRASNNRTLESRVLNNIGLGYSWLGENKKALDFLGQALAIQREVADRDGQATTLLNIGTVYGAFGDKQKAFEFFGQALSLWRAAGNRDGEAAALNNIGMIHSDLGEKQEALDYYNRALPIFREARDRSGEASALSNIGEVYSSIGEKQKALDYFDQALAIRRTLGEREGEANTLNNLAAVYRDLGENQRALDSFLEALPLVRVAGNRAGEATVLSNIGLAYSDLGEYQKAFDYLEQSLPLRNAAGDRAGEATTLHNIGWVHDLLGEKKKAVEYYEQALPLWRASGNRDGEAFTLNNIGHAHDSIGNKQGAIDYYQRALPLWQAVSDPSGEALTDYNLARAERDLGNLDQARASIEAALSIVESLRTKVTSQQFRASYFASVQKYYEFYIDLLMRLNKLHQLEELQAEAFQASERARARSLLEMLIEARADIRQGVDPGLLARERSLEQLLSARTERQIRLLAGKHTVEQAAASKREIDALTAEFQRLEAEIRSRNPRYAALTQPRTVSLRELQQNLLDQDTLLLEYALGDERSYVWAVTASTEGTYELPKRSDIEAAARSFYEVLTAPNHQPESARDKRGLRLAVANDQDPKMRDAGMGLSSLLFGPVAALLGKKRLVIVADGALHYVPFAALPEPTATHKGSERLKPLVLDHEIVSLPSASALAVLREEIAGHNPAPKEIVVLADPVFDKDDERVERRNALTKSDQKPNGSAGDRALFVKVGKAATETGVAERGLTIPRLPGTRREAERILALAPESGRMLALDFAASRATAASDQMSQYRFIHFATHGFLNSVHPELSGLVLSMVDQSGAPQNGFLLADEVYNLKLAAELVVLSACQTGLGKAVKGEGLVGLARGFMYAGASRVVVSLWSVNDEATAELMERFYRAMLKKQMRQAAALRTAQVEMWNQKRWRAPYYWAAFTLQGEWR